MMFAVGLPWRDGGSDQVWSRWYRRLCGRLFLCLYKLGKEAVNGVNTGVCGYSGAFGDWLERVKIKGGRRQRTWLWECVEKALKMG